MAIWSTKSESHYFDEKNIGNDRYSKGETNSKQQSHEVGKKIRNHDNGGASPNHWIFQCIWFKAMTATAMAYYDSSYQDLYL